MNVRRTEKLCKREIERGLVERVFRNLCRSAIGGSSGWQ